MKFFNDVLEHISQVATFHIRTATKRLQLQLLPLHCIMSQQFLADCTSLTLHTPSFSTPASPHHFFSRISEKWSQDFFLPSNFLVFFIITFIMAAIMTGPTSRMEFRDWLLVNACALRLVEL